MWPLLYIRQGLYAFLLVCSVVLSALTVARVSYTSRPRTERSLNNGRPFYGAPLVDLPPTLLIHAARDRSIGGRAAGLGSPHSLLCPFNASILFAKSRSDFRRPLT